MANLQKPGEEPSKSGEYIEHGSRGGKAPNPRQVTIEKGDTLSTSITELLPSIAALSHADKFRLVQFVLAQIAQEDGIEVEETQQPATPFDPHLFFGVAQQPKQVIDDYLTSTREGWL
jgi:YjzC-like protein